jgi:hypothetical protein
MMCRKKYALLLSVVTYSMTYTQEAPGVDQVWRDVQAVAKDE